ncbi:MAG TPA: hypothetical protein DEQ43_03115 [Nocardioides bacterium]|uniref:resuscitation-promoting factor n=1 Tax=uncultured Nocardioides sp. TaxID=198441 RepID=UPI000ECA7A3D|nr:resuscitation-promoting factor [uncultured Nocardioides sp.]HCB03237.1 hypothetical protein [Nocardioides sp.]HRD64422.1 resuscitation-promoting factor [Nocardioides sp.]
MHCHGSPKTPRGASRRARRTAVLAAGTAALSAALVASAVGPAAASPAKGDLPGVVEKAGYVHVRIVTKTIERQKYAEDVIEREDNTMNVGEVKVVRPGRPGIRDITYRFRLENGHVVKRTEVDTEVHRKARAKVVRVGTKEPFGVWDRLADCESGGNWHINTGNGYYGGLQFSLGTWRAYGGTGLPSQHSRETQIAIAIKLRNASGGYGAWPACAARLGLPR